MTGKADFTDAEWETVLHGPTTAALIVITAQRGGTFRETFAITKTWAEARKHPGSSQLVDEIVAAKPSLGHTYKSPAELRSGGLAKLAEAIEILERKTAGDEIGAYRQFVLALAERVASAHREGGVEISDAEREALDAIEAAVKEPR